jgi:L-ascorbate metabolism protein UlaG (beta-lactamase superfamily)
MILKGLAKLSGRIKVVIAVLIGISLAGALIIATSWVATGQRPLGAHLAAIKTSPNWREGKFFNALGAKNAGLFKIMGKVLSGTDNATPDSAIPIVRRAASDFDVAPSSGLRITWLGHSSLLIEIDGRRVLVDPVLSERASPFTWAGPARFHEAPISIDDLPEIDVVVISHDHYDHLDHRTIQALGDRVPLYVVPLGVGAHLQFWGVPPERIIERDWWGEVKQGGLTITATPGRHFSGRSLVMTDQNKTLWAGWVIAGPEHRVYYSGDTGMFHGFSAIGKRLGPFDAVLIETGAYDSLWCNVHLGPEQAIEARLALGSGLVIPVHWGTFNLGMHAWTEPVDA